MTDSVPACQTFTEGVVRGFCRLCGQIPADHPHGEIRDQGAENVAMSYDEATIRQAVYDAYFDSFGGDQQDQDDIEAADAFCKQVLWRLQQIDGRVGDD